MARLPVARLPVFLTLTRDIIMIASVFGSTDSMFLILLSIIFHAVRSLHDGLCDRGAYFIGIRNNTHYKTVGWWPWHIVNWAGRDIFVAAIYVWLYLTGTPLLTLVTAVVIIWFLHDLLYWYTVSHRKFFEGGENGFRFPSLFKKIFKRA